MARPVWVRDDLAQQGSLLPRPYCAHCSAAGVCGAQSSANACRPENHIPGLGHPLDDCTLSRLRELQGWELSDIIALPTRLPRLPPYVPIVEPRGAGQGTDLPFLAVTFKDAFDEGGSSQKARTLRSRLKLRAGTKLLLLCTGRDPLLAAALDRAMPDLLAGIARGAFDIVSGLATSCYRDYPAMENLLSLKEGLLSFRQMQERGIPAFPMFSFATDRDIARVAEWLHNNPCVRLVGLDFQDAVPPHEWRFMVRGLRQLATLAPDDIHYVIKGPSSPSRIRRLFSVTPRLTVVTQHADMTAALGGAKFPGKTKQWIFAHENQRLLRICKKAKAEAA